MLCRPGPGRFTPRPLPLQRALSGGTARIIVGALPFEIDSPAALGFPAGATHRGSAPLANDAHADYPGRRAARRCPNGEHRARVAEAMRRFRTPGSDLHKVVLARALRVQAEAPWDPRTILRPAGRRRRSRPTRIWSTCRRPAPPTPAPRWWARAQSCWWTGRRAGDMPAVRRVGAAVGRPRSSIAPMPRTGRFRQEPSRAPVGHRRHAGNAGTVVHRSADRAASRSCMAPTRCGTWVRRSPARLRETSTTALDLALSAASDTGRRRGPHRRGERR